MPTSAQIQKKLAELAAKRAGIDRKISEAQGKKAKKDAEADSKASSAVNSKSDSIRKSHQRQSDSARKEAQRQGDKIAALSKELAKISADVGTQQKALTAAEKSETAAAKRESDKARRAREDQQRKDDAARKADDRRRQQQRREDERRREADLADTSAQIAHTEQRLASAIAELREPKAEQLRILYATASTDPDKPLRVDQEIRRVQAAVRASTHRDIVNVKPLLAATPSDVLDELTRFRPHVVHFSGHATDLDLVFDEGTDAPGPEGGKRVGADLFRELLESTGEPPVLVVLNACETEAQLQALLGKVPMAVGMSASIADVDAIVFAARFYATLCEGLSVGAAVDTAQTQMRLDGLPDHDLPTLVAVEGVDPRTVRLITGE